MSFGRRLSFLLYTLAMLEENWKVTWSPASEEQRAQWKTVLDNPSSLPHEFHLPSLEYILCRAIFSKDYNLVKVCLSHGAELNSWVHESVGRGCLSMELMQILIPAGLDVNYNVDRLGGYLAGSVQKKDMGLTQYLLEQGADPNRNPLTDMFPALNLAVRANSAEMVELLIHYGAKVDGLGALGTAARHSLFEMMDLLLVHYRADVNDSAKERRKCCAINMNKDFTALHEAASVGKVDVVAYLIEHGASLDMREARGRTPSMLAREKEHWEVVALLDKVQV